MLLTVNMRDKRPIYKQIVGGIKNRILSGELKADEQIPSVRQLATDMNINPNTIAKAYAELERLGVVYSARGRGYFVSPDISGAREEEKEEIRRALLLCAENAERCGVEKALVTEMALSAIDEAYEVYKDINERNGENDKNK